MDGGVQASHLDRGSLQGGERARKDRGGETSRGERAQEERVAALQCEPESLVGGGEQLLHRGGDGRTAARRDDRALAQLDDTDMWSCRGAAGREGGDRLFPAQSLDG